MVGTLKQETVQLSQATFFTVPLSKWWISSWMIWLLLSENMCTLRGETSETPLNISERVRTFSGVPLLVSNFWELHYWVSYPIPQFISYMFPVLSKTQNFANRRDGGRGVRMLQRCQVQRSVAWCIRSCYSCISTLYIWGTIQALRARRRENYYLYVLEE